MSRFFCLLHALFLASLCFHIRPPKVLLKAMLVSLLPCLPFVVMSFCLSVSLCHSV